MVNEWVVDHRDYPPALQVTDLTFSVDGKKATFRVCQRGGECSGFQTIDIGGEESPGGA